MDPWMQISRDPEISMTTKMIQNNVRKSDDVEKELQRSNDVNIPRSSNLEIYKSRDRKIPRFNGSRSSMEPGMQRSSDPEISTTRKEIHD